MTSTTVTPAQAADQRVMAAITSATADPSDLAPYRALSDRKERGRVRSAIESRRDSAVSKADPTDADSVASAVATFQHLDAVLTAIKSAGSTPTKPTVEPFVGIANRIATLRLAADLLESGMVAPDDAEAYGFDADTVRDLATAVSYGDAMTLATAKVTRTRSANQYDTEDAFRAAFDGEKVGTVLKVSEVCQRWSANGGPEKPSDANGRVSARLFAPSGCTITWVEPMTDADGTNKRVKLIAPIPTA